MKDEDLDTKWHIPNNQLLFEEWGDEAVVYDAKSGETHQLNRLAVDVLKAIQKQPVSMTILTDNICSIYEVEDHLDLERQLKGLISQFDILGLIEPLVE